MVQNGMEKPSLFTKFNKSAKIKQQYKSTSVYLLILWPSLQLTHKNAFILIPIFDAKRRPF